MSKEKDFMRKYFLDHIDIEDLREHAIPTKILALIESVDKGPEVDEKFIHRWCCRLGELLPSDAAYQIRMILREAGVKVKEET